MKIQLLSFIWSVGDSLDNQYLVNRLLSKNGVWVEIAGDGAQAVDKALTNINTQMCDFAETTQHASKIKESLLYLPMVGTPKIFKDNK